VERVSVLPLSGGAVKDHNGYIDIQSVEGKGSTFTLYFPVTREGLDTRRERLSPAASMGRGECLLVVDDVRGAKNACHGNAQKTWI